MNSTSIRIALTNISNSNLKNGFYMILNYFFALLKTKTASSPTEVQIEPSSVCNLKCQMCNLDKNHQYSRFLTPSSFSKIISQIPHLQTVNLTGMGEILLNPFLDKIIQIAHKKSISINLVTNLQLLSPENVKTILKPSVKIISISLESGLKKNYELIRTGAKYQQLLKNIRLLQASKTKFRSKTRIGFNVVLFETSLTKIDNIKSIIKLASDFEINQITFQNPHLFKPAKPISWYQNRFDEISVFAKLNNISIRLPPLIKKPNSCYYPWIYPQITANGDVLPCCLIPQFFNYTKSIENFSFGNVFSSSFSKIWNNQKAQVFRSNHIKSIQSPCINCSKFKGTL